MVVREMEFRRGAPTRRLRHFMFGIDREESHKSTRVMTSELHLYFAAKRRCVLETGRIWGSLRRVEPCAQRLT
jgi:hypothetical protein